MYANVETPVSVPNLELNVASEDSSMNHSKCFLTVSLLYSLNYYNLKTCMHASTICSDFIINTESFLIGFCFDEINMNYDTSV